MPKTNSHHKLAIAVRGGLKPLKEAREQVCRLLEESRFPEDRVFAARLALQEALINAYRHGNDSDPEKPVYLTCNVRADVACIEVRDEGNGFVPAAVPNPLEPENLAKPGGRGLTLIESFMDKVDYCQQGTCVVMELRRFPSCSKPRRNSMAGTGKKEHVFHKTDWSKQTAGSDRNAGIKPKN